MESTCLSHLRHQARRLADLFQTFLRLLRSRTLHILGAAWVIVRDRDWQGLQDTVALFSIFWFWGLSVANNCDCVQCRITQGCPQVYWAQPGCPCCMTSWPPQACASCAVCTVDIRLVAAAASRRSCRHGFKKSARRLKVPPSYTNKAGGISIEQSEDLQLKPRTQKLSPKAGSVSI